MPALRSVQPAVSLLVAACPNRCLDFGDMDELRQSTVLTWSAMLPVFPGFGHPALRADQGKDCAKKELGEKLYL